MTMASSSNNEPKFDIEPWDGTPGDAYDKFEIRLLNAGSRTPLSRVSIREARVYELLEPRPLL